MGTGSEREGEAAPANVHLALPQTSWHFICPAPLRSCVLYPPPASAAHCPGLAPVMSAAGTPGGTPAPAPPLVITGSRRAPVGP